MIPRVDCWIENTERAFHSLAERGSEWLSLEEIALQIRIEAHDRRRARRSKVANSMLDMMGLGARPTKSSAKTRFQTSVAIEDMMIEGAVERRFFDAEGELLKEGDEIAPHFRIIDQNQTVSCELTADTAAEAPAASPRRYPGAHIM